MENLLKLGDVAKMLGVGERFVRNATRKGERPRLGFVRLGNRLRFTDAHVAEFLVHFEKLRSKNEKA
jgi:excisionase family DNA binding protein